MSLFISQKNDRKITAMALKPLQPNTPNLFLELNAHGFITLRIVSLRRRNFNPITGSRTPHKWKVLYTGSYSGSVFFATSVCIQLCREKQNSFPLPRPRASFCPENKVTCSVVWFMIKQLLPSDCRWKLVNIYLRLASGITMISTRAFPLNSRRRHSVSQSVSQLVSAPTPSWLSRGMNTTGTDWLKHFHSFLKEQKLSYVMRIINGSFVLIFPYWNSRATISVWPHLCAWLCVPKLNC